MYDPITRQWNHLLSIDHETHAVEYRTKMNFIEHHGKRELFITSVNAQGAINVMICDLNQKKWKKTRSPKRFGFYQTNKQPNRRFLPSINTRLTITNNQVKLWVFSSLNSSITKTARYTPSIDKWERIESDQKNASLPYLSTRFVNIDRTNCLYRMLIKGGKRTVYRYYSNQSTWQAVATLPAQLLKERFLAMHAVKIGTQEKLLVVTDKRSIGLWCFTLGEKTNPWKRLADGPKLSGPINLSVPTAGPLGIFTRIFSSRGKHKLLFTELTEKHKIRVSLYHILADKWEYVPFTLRYKGPFTRRKSQHARGGVHVPQQYLASVSTLHYPDFCTLVSGDRSFLTLSYIKSKRLITVQHALEPSLTLSTIAENRMKMIGDRVDRPIETQPLFKEVNRLIAMHLNETGKLLLLFKKLGDQADRLNKNVWKLKATSSDRKQLIEKQKIKIKKILVLFNSIEKIEGNPRAIHKIIGMINKLKEIEQHVKSSFPLYKISKAWDILLEEFKQAALKYPRAKL